MNVGLDNGRGNVKVVSFNNRIKFESYCGKARDLDFTYGNENYRATINGVEYFVGEIAKREGMARGFQKNKIDKERTIPLVLTGIYLLAEHEDVSVNIVTGTPISDYKQQKEEIEKFLVGTYHVQLKDKPKKTIHINNVKVFPEGAGAYFSKVLNVSGEVFNKDLATSKVGIIDIGYKTINICVFENLKFVDIESTTFNYGIYKAFNMVYKRLIRTEDITPEQAEKITEGPEFEQLAAKLQNEINKFWNNTSFKIFLCGGGAYLIKKYFPTLDVICNSEFANAEGYFKIAQMLYKPEKIVWSLVK